MSSYGLRDTPQWQVGEVAVAATCRFLMGCGFLILRADLIENGGPPAFVGADGRGQVITPDLVAARAGRTRWVEVKFKTAAVPYGKTPGTWRTGVDERNWRQYLEVQRITGAPGWLAIVQLRPAGKLAAEPELQLATLDHLARRATPHIGAGDRKVWWDIDDFERFPIVIDGAGALELPPRLVERPWERPARDGTVPRCPPPGQRQLSLFDEPDDLEL